MKKLFNKIKSESVVHSAGSTEESKSILSEEQEAYVRYHFWTNREDTVLLSVAGSGKTRCVIEKMRYLALKNVCTKKQMLVFSFSKFTIESMKHRCAEYQDASVFCE